MMDDDDLDDCDHGERVQCDCSGGFFTADEHHNQRFCAQFVKMPTQDESEDREDDEWLSQGHSMTYKVEFLYRSN